MTLRCKCGGAQTVVTAWRNTEWSGNALRCRKCGALGYDTPKRKSWIQRNPNLFVFVVGLVLGCIAVASHVFGSRPAEAQSHPPPALPRGCRDRSCVRSRVVSSGLPPPAFEFAPVNGAGMGTACACTTPTGSKGEALTFTRASSGTCLKQGVGQTGIANGDMVTCGFGTPRVMPGANGYLGLLKEHARTNACLQSQAFDNAAWVKASSVVAVPTVTADQAVAPDGTTSAERIQFPATTGTQFSVVDQTVASTAPFAGSVFLRGNSTTGSLDVDCQNGAADSCKTCSFVSGSWTRCDCEASSGSSQQLLIIGNYSTCSAGSRSAQDVFVWGGDIETIASGGGPSSYIATTTASVTRAVELSQVLSETFATNSTGSFAVSIIANTALNDAEHGLVAQSTAGPAYGQLLDFVGNTSSLNVYFSLGSAIFTGATVTPFTATRMAGFWDTAVNAVSCYAGTCGGTPLANPPVTTTNAVEIGQYSGQAQLDGVINQICVDSNKQRCR